MTTADEVYDNFDPIADDLRRGSMAAYETVLSLYERDIFNFVYRLSGNAMDAQDLTQEVFIKVYKYHRRVDPSKKLKAWIYKIATNTTYDFLRKKRNLNRELFILNDDEPFETIDEKDTYKQVEAKHDLDQAFSGLKPAYRTILDLAFYQELSYEEIADILALPLNTVKTHVRRAKEALRSHLEKYESGAWSTIKKTGGTWSA